MKDKKIPLINFHPSKKGMEKVLGELEASIMECVWEAKKATVRYVHDCLSIKREIAYTTVMTVMGRLSDKGYLSKKKSKNAYLYFPAVTKDGLQKSVVGSVMEGLVEHMSAGSLAHFVDTISKADNKVLDELERLIALKKQEFGV